LSNPRKPDPIRELEAEKPYRLRGRATAASGDQMQRLRRAQRRKGQLVCALGLQAEGERTQQRIQHF